MKQIYSLSEAAIGAVRSRAESSGLPMSAVVDVLIGACLPRVSDDTLRRLLSERGGAAVGAVPSTGPTPARLGAYAAQVRATLERMTAAAAASGIFRFERAGIIRESGLPSFRVVQGLAQLKAAGLASDWTPEDGQPCATGELQRSDRYGRPVFSHWWLVSADQAYEARRAAAAAAARGDL